MLFLTKCERCGCRKMLSCSCGGRTWEEIAEADRLENEAREAEERAAREAAEKEYLERRARLKGELDTQRDGESLAEYSRRRRMGMLDLGRGPFEYVSFTDTEQ